MFEEILTQIQSLTPALVLTLGLVIGLKHAFEPDHIAAVSTQISIQKNNSQSLKQRIIEGAFKSSLIGAIWGAGHTTTLVLIGLLVYVLSINIPDIANTIPRIVSIGGFLAIIAINCSTLSNFY